MKTLVISDIHNRTAKAEKLLKEVEHDKVVFLGDYFDQFGDNANDAGNTARFLKKHINNPNYIFLTGNHDIWNFYPNDYLWCPGNSHEKRRMIRSILDENDCKKFKLAHYEQGWWCSHAGLHEHYFVHPVKGFTHEGVEERCKEALHKAERHIVDPVLMAGIDRGGSIHIPEGSILWADWRVFKAIPDTNQIVGHTPSDYVRCKLVDCTINFCLDTHSKHYIIIEDGFVRTYTCDHVPVTDVIKAQSVTPPEDPLEEDLILQIRPPKKT